MTGSIFISYSHEDRDFMLRLREDLAARGFNVWVDDHSLVPGTPSWESAIEKGITQADHIVVIMSPEAKNSLWVTREIAVAEGANKDIIPILIKGDEASSVPFRLISTQRIDARDDYSEAFNVLVNTLSGERQQILTQPRKKPRLRIQKGIIIAAAFLLICICSGTLIVANNLGLFSSLLPADETPIPPASTTVPTHTPTSTTVPTYTPTSITVPTHTPTSTTVPTHTPTATPNPFYTAGLITYVVESEDGDWLFALDKDGNSHLLTEKLHRVVGVSSDLSHLVLVVESVDSSGLYDLIIVSPNGDLLQEIVRGAEEVNAAYLANNQLLVIIQDEFQIIYHKYCIEDSSYELSYISENVDWSENPPTVVAIETEEVIETVEVRDGE